MARFLDSSRRSRQAGQAIFLFALTMVVMLTGIGVAMDAESAYYWNAAAERAAAAGALSGVIFTPNQFAPAQAIPTGSGNDATDRAVAEARRNRFDTADTADNVKVVPSTIPGKTNQLQVTVSRRVPALFLVAFGLGSYTVKRSAVASYLPPIDIGQPGNQIGSTVAELGANGNYFFEEIQGWGADRDNGESFSPDPSVEWGAPLNPPSQDVHQLSAQTGIDTVDSSLPVRGGYNYRITLGSPGYIQVYNAVEGPDTAGPFNQGGNPNNCDNGRVSGRIGPCNGDPSYAYGEGSTDSDLGTAWKYTTMEYTLFKVNNLFIRSSDTELAQFKVSPIDASNWDAGEYKAVNSGATIKQKYNADGTPANMAIYHNWVDVASYTGADDAGLVQRMLTYGSGLLPAGTYRLRVDSLSDSGTNPPAPNNSYKDYVVRAVDSTGKQPCTDCSVAAWNDLCISTPIRVPGGGSFSLPLFALPPDYAGQTLTVDVYDAGDVSGSGNVDLNLLDNTGAVASVPGLTTTVYDLETSRTGTTPALIGTPAQATFRAVDSGTILWQGRWVEMQIPVSASYSPGPDPTKWFWSLQYVTSGSVQATDTLTVAIGVHGLPAHLIAG